MPISPAYPSKVYLNGEILDAGNALISVFDRGFLFGDGIYEVMPKINGRFFYRDAHMDRLRWCLTQIGIKADIVALELAIPGLLESSGLTGIDCLLYIQVTRGTAPRQHAYPKNITPTVMMYAWAKTLPDINDDHASVVTTLDYRWSRCDIKSTSLLGNVMANDYAMRHHNYETLFVRGGLITEASHCNVFFVKDGIIYTHPSGPFILDGITRLVVLELCSKLGFKLCHEGVPATDLHTMDEAFITGTSTQVLAIKKLDGHMYFKDQPGPVTRQLQEAFLELKNAL